MFELQGNFMVERLEIQDPIGEAHQRVKQSRDPDDGSYTLSPAECSRGKPTSVSAALPHYGKSYKRIGSAERSLLLPQVYHQLKHGFVLRIYNAFSGANPDSMTKSEIQKILQKLPKDWDWDIISYKEFARTALVQVQIVTLSLLMF